MTAACFGEGIYDEQPTEKCISNLLASQFRRLIIDLYWDALNRRWGLCPVQIPPAQANASSTDAPNASGRIKRDEHSQNEVRQSSDNSSTSATPVSSSTLLSTTTSSTGTAATVTSTSGAILVELGPYKCSTDLDLSSVVKLYSDYFQNTSNTLQGKLQFLDFSLHAAAPYSDPSAPAAAPSANELPVGNELVGAQFDTISRLIYTPEHLQDDRLNLNDSWFAFTPLSGYPIVQYFDVNVGPLQTLSTPNGWPNEYWMLVSRLLRLVLSWNRIDPQMQSYDFGSDSTTIFDVDALNVNRSVSINDDGSLTDGCWYDAAVTEIKQMNSSWSTLTLTQAGQNLSQDLVANLTACGISPILNSSYQNDDATNNIGPYQSFPNAAVFNWAAGEPRNVSNDSSPYQCALLDTTQSYQGYWRVENCQGKYRAACRIAGQPYLWQLSSSEVPFESTVSACDSNSTFDLPRTGLENTYLYNTILSSNQTSEDGSPISGVWVNFNSLDVQGCWVSTGPNGTCPYFPNNQTTQKRDVLIPTIGALIVLILTALTLLVKCNINRRNSRARRRGEGGWDYEGVPS